MGKFVNWLSLSFAPKVRTVFANPWIDMVASTMKKVLPFILTGSLISFYNVFRSYIPFLPDLGIVFSYTFMLLSVFIAFLIAHEGMVKLKHEQYKINAGMTSVAAFLLYCRPEIADGKFSVIYDKLGPSGIMLGMVVGLLVVIVFHLYTKLHVLENNSSIPDFVSDWINNIIPISVTMLTGMVLVQILDLDFYNIIISLFMPLQKGAQTLPGFILICLIPAMFYTMGISGWVFEAITAPIFMIAIAENIQAVASGMPAMNITTSETIFTAALITMGGRGATLPLNLMMLKSKAKKLNVMAKICIGPSLFNINEPLMFGAPVVFNPLLMVPMWLNNIVGPLVVWLAMHFGALNIPCQLIQVGQIPAPLSSVIITQDFRAILVWAVLLVLYIVIWYPFYKVYEAQCLKDEQAEGVN